MITEEENSRPCPSFPNESFQGVVDCHTHRYPEVIFEDPINWALSRKERLWAELVQGKAKNGVALHTWVDSQRFLADMRDGNVSWVLLLGWYWEHQETCRWHNAWLVRWIAEDPKRFKAFACVQPREGARALEDLKKAIDGGCCGVGEIFPAAQGFSLRDPSWLNIVKWATERKLPISLHVPEPVGRSYKGRIEVPLADYQWLISEFPETIFILAHWGGGLFFYELNPFIERRFQNVYYDTAATPLLYRPEIFRVTQNIISPSKLLFGTDYPLKIYPNDPLAPNFKQLIETVKMQLPPEEAHQVLWLNAHRLFGGHSGSCCENLAG